MATEFDLFKRRIVLVEEYWDEEGYPWLFVERSGDGRFDAVTTVCIDGEGEGPGEAREYSLGIFDTQDKAVAALRHCERIIGDAFEALMVSIHGEDRHNFDFNEASPRVIFH